VSRSASHAAPAFEDLLAAHRGIVLKIAASYCQGPEDRADLAQDIHLQLWRAWPSYEASRSFSTWMYRVALNVAISHRRAESGRGAHEPLDEGHDGLVGAEDVDAGARQQLEQVAQAMRVFNALDRALLVLHLEGCSHREIGEVMGISESNAATRLGRIRQQLRRQVGAGEGDEHGHG
jgi:RNA polymerase sigma-70 factor (ECF subfamily)